MNTAVIAVARSQEAPRGPALSLARALRREGVSCTLIWAFPGWRPVDAQPPMTDLDVVYVDPPEETIGRRPDWPLPQLAERLAPLLRRFDVVYSLLHGHPAMHLLRERRFGASRSPFCVTVVEDPPQRVPSELPLFSPAIGGQEFGERYQVQFSDLVVCLPPARAESGGDPDRWRRLHRDVVALAIGASRTPNTLRPATTAPSATVCVVAREADGSALATLASLKAQTSSDFSALVLDGPAAPRPLAVRSEYLIFLEAGDVASPRFVARLIEAARFSGADLLAFWALHVADDAPSAASRRRQAGPSRDWLDAPAGDDPMGSLVGDADGGFRCLVRRDAFEALTEPDYGDAAAGLRDLRTPAALSGHACDVVPECLCLVPDSPERRSTWARDHGHPDAAGWVLHDRPGWARLPSFVPALRSLEATRREEQRRVEGLHRQLARRFPAGSSRERLRLLLVLPHWPYPPVSGAFWRWWAMIRYFGTRHELTVASFLSRGDETSRAQLLRYCQSVHAVREGGRAPASAAGLPFAVRARQSLDMREALQAIPTHRFDAAVLQQIFLAPYRDCIEAPTVLGEDNVESTLLAQAAEGRFHGALTPGFSDPLREASLMRDYEVLTWARFPLRTAVSARDAEEMDRRAGSGRTLVVENGTEPGFRLRRYRADTGHVLFVGMLEYFPNVDAVLYAWHDIWPHLARRDPSLRFLVAGRNPTAEVRALRGRPGFVLVENPRDIRRVAALASVSIVPLRLGSGTRCKILDSMALGLPVVSTALGCEGLAVEDGEHILVRDDPAAFADAVHQVLHDATLRERLRASGARLIERRYRWDRVFDPLNDALVGLARAREALGEAP